MKRIYKRVNSLVWIFSQSAKNNDKSTILPLPEEFMYICAFFVVGE